MVFRKLVALCWLAVGVDSVQQQQMQQANPIRRVVSMLQMMQQKVTAEGQKQEDAYNKFMCYCKTNGGELSSSIQSARDQIAELTASTKADAEKKEQTEADLKANVASRDDAKETMAKAVALRKKEGSAFAKEKSDYETNLAALEKAIPAIESGMFGSFLQTPDAGLVRRYVMERASVPDRSRDELLSFLSGGESQKYVPQSGEIVGILKTIHDEMTASLKDATNEENTAISNFDALMAAKKREVATLQKQIETEMGRIGDLGATLAGGKNDLQDTQESLAEDDKFKAELEKGCDTKTAQWEQIKSTRAEELQALAETIKVLNDDDALEIFKKTLPSAAMSLVQVEVGIAERKGRALSLISKARKIAQMGHGIAQPQLDFLELALRGKTVGFEKVIAMIDAMSSNLLKEQQEDTQKKEYCDSSFDEFDDKRKTLENSISDSEAAVTEMKGTIAELTSQISELVAGIKALDKMVSDATAQRQQENAAFKELISDDTTAKELLLHAKNRLNKFYNPKLYKPPPERELTEEERITVNMGGTVTTAAPSGIAGTGIGAALIEVSVHEQHEVAPPPPPETFGPYAKKSSEGNGVVAMMDLLVKDLDKEMQEAKVNEKDSQQEYEIMMQESADKRVADSKSVTDKSAEKASTEESLEAEKDTMSETSREHMNTMKTIASLHGECDWLLKYFEARKEARAGEVDALSNAKAVLSGANYA